MQTKILSIIVSLLFFGIVIELVRRQRLTFKYAAGWLAIASVAIFFSVFHTALYRLAAWCGFVLPSNFLFFAMLCMFVFLSLLLTTFLCEQNTRNDTMAQKIGRLEFEIAKLKEKK